MHYCVSMAASTLYLVIASLIGGRSIITEKKSRPCSSLTVSVGFIDARPGARDGYRCKRNKHVRVIDVSPECKRALWFARSFFPRPHPRQRASTIVTFVMPPPSHMVCNALRLPRLLSVWTSVAMSLAPEAPSGCPRAIAPPKRLRVDLRGSWRPPHLRGRRGCTRFSTYQC